jgi:hypothetical protein
MFVVSIGFDNDLLLHMQQLLHALERKLCCGGLLGVQLYFVVNHGCDLNSLLLQRYSHEI